MVPRRAVADADIKQIELGIVRHRVPDGAAAAERPPLAAPRGGGHLHRGVLEAVGRIAGHGIEAPCELAGVGVVGRDVAAHAELGAAVADQHLAFDDARRAGDRVRLRAVDGVDVPELLSRGRIERDQPAVERADEDLAFPQRDAAIDDVAASVDGPFAGHFGIVGPQRLARRRVEGVDFAPRGRDVENAVRDQRRRLLAATRVEVGEPREPELADGFPVDLFERAETLLAVGSPVRQPLSRLGVGSDQASGVHRGGLRCRGRVIR